MNESNNGQPVLQQTENGLLPNQSPKKTMLENIVSETIDWLEVFALALSLMVVLFLFVFKYVSVDGTSMLNTLQDKDKLIISSNFLSFEQGDIIVFHSDSFLQPLVKRIIATEGQTVEIDFDNWIIKVDGEALDEPYIKTELSKLHGSQWYEGPITVGEGKLFVMGDNRNGSEDSRYPSVGQVDIRDVLGKVLVRIFPFSKIGTVE